MTATIKVLSAGACEGPLHQLAPEFTKESGQPVELVFNTVGALRKLLADGERADLIVLSGHAIDALEKEGSLVSGSRNDLGRATCGVAVRDGTLPPNIATAEAFQRMLTFAQSIAMPDPANGGSSGIYLTGLFERLGLTGQINPKLVLRKTGRDVGLAVASGAAEVGMTFTSEFVPIAGLRIVGQLPPEHALVSAYTAAIPAEGAAVIPARKLIEFLTSPRSKSTFAAFGLE